MALAPGPQDEPIVLTEVEQDRLGELERALATARSTAGAARLVLQACIDALGVGEISILATSGYPAAVSEHWGRFPVAADLPASEAVRTGRPVVVRTRAERDERAPSLTATPLLDSQTVVCVPLLGDELPARVVLDLSFDRSRDVGARELHLLAEFARRATPALFA